MKNTLEKFWRLEDGYDNTYNNDLTCDNPVTFKSENMKIIKTRTIITRIKYLISSILYVFGLSKFFGKSMEFWVETKKPCEVIFYLGGKEINKLDLNETEEWKHITFTINNK